MNRIFLVADIGGTNCRVSIFSLIDDELKEEFNQEYLTSDIKNFKELLRNIGSNDHFEIAKIDTVVVAAAGPVSSVGICTPPNIPWTLSLGDLKEFYANSKVFLINDFLAQSYAVLTPLVKNGSIIKKGQDLSKGIIGVIGPGTGLGKSFLSVQSPNNAVGFPSEGGHVAFPVTSNEELKFTDFVKAKENSEYVTCEHVTSGRVLSYLYEYYYGDLITVEEVGDKLKSEKLDLLTKNYSRFLGRVCRDFALEILAEAGIYIAGGVLAKSPELLDDRIFIEEFENSPTQKQFLSTVKIVNFSNNDSGLWGAAKFASLA